MVSAINDRIKYVDTNVLLSHLDQLENEDFFFLSSVTLEELEDIKTNKNKTEDLRYAARKAAASAGRHIWSGLTGSTDGRFCIC